MKEPVFESDVNRLQQAKYYDNLPNVYGDFRCVQAAQRNVVHVYNFTADNLTGKTQTRRKKKKITNHFVNNLMEDVLRMSLCCMCLCLCCSTTFGFVMKR